MTIIWAWQHEVLEWWGACDFNEIQSNFHDGWASIKASKNQKKRTINEECKDCSICYDMNCETYYKGADDKGNVIHTDLVETVWQYPLHLQYMHGGHCECTIIMIQCTDCGKFIIYDIIMIVMCLIHKNLVDICWPVYNYSMVLIDSKIGITFQISISCNICCNY